MIERDRRQTGGRAQDPVARDVEHVQHGHQDVKVEPFHDQCASFWRISTRPLLPSIRTVAPSGMIFVAPGSDDRGDAEVARDDRAVRQHAAALDDDARRVDEERRPARDRSWADEHVALAQLARVGRRMEDPRRARSDARRDARAAEDAVLRRGPLLVAAERLRSDARRISGIGSRWQAFHRSFRSWICAVKLGAPAT